jgi:hypothetical protein
MKKWSRWESTRWAVVVWCLSLLTAIIAGWLAGVIVVGAETSVLAGVAATYVAGKSYEKRWTVGKGDTCGEE